MWRLRGDARRATSHQRNHESLINRLSAIWDTIPEDGLRIGHDRALTPVNLRGTSAGPARRAQPDRAAAVPTPQIFWRPSQLETGEQLGVGRHAAEVDSPSSAICRRTCELCPWPAKLERASRSSSGRRRRFQPAAALWRRPLPARLDIEVRQPCPPRNHRGGTKGTPYGGAGTFSPLALCPALCGHD